MEQSSSKTALAVAARRAVHQLIDAAPKILDDPVVVQLLDPAYLDQLLSNRAQLQTRSAQALRAHVVIRARFAENRLAKAVERGVQQYVILGAGLDTFAYRQPDWAHTLRIFEVDQPASQQEKRARLQAAHIPTPANVTFVPIDFEATPLLDGLSKHGFDPTRPTFVSWLGVIMYLTQDAIDTIFKFVVALPQCSEIVFTFAPPPTDEAKDRAYAGLIERAANVGEPWITLITPEELVQYLSTMGFAQVFIPTPTEINARYTTNRTDGLQASARSTLASAII